MATVTGALVTVIVTGATASEPAKVPSPRNRAATVWLPKGSVPRLNRAWPLAPTSTGAWLTPSTTKASCAPGLIRLPVHGDGLTVAVANTASPRPVVLWGELIVVVVEA